MQSHIFAMLWHAQVDVGTEKALSLTKRMITSSSVCVIDFFGKNEFENRFSNDKKSLNKTVVTNSD